MTNHTYNVGDEVLIRGTIARFDAVSNPIITPMSGGFAFTISETSITQSTPSEPFTLSVALDRHGFAWQRRDGEWWQGDTAHTWDYLLHHCGPMNVVHRTKPTW